MVFMSHKHLLQSELESATGFDAAYPNYSVLMCDWLGTLFRLSYFAGQPAAPDGAHFFTLERVTRLPYILRASWLTTRSGYYAESAVFIRAMLEAFVQLRYFNAHAGSLVPHLSSKTRKDQVSFFTMFQAFAAGYYDDHYRVLCSIAHSGAGLSVLSGMEEMNDGSGRMLPPIGCKFDSDVSSYIVNHTMMLLAGYMTCFPIWFPDYAALVDEETEQRRNAAVDSFREWRAGLRANHPNTASWIERSEQLMNLGASATGSSAGVR